MREEPADILQHVGAARRRLGHALQALTPPPEPLCPGCGYGLAQCECAELGAGLIQGECWAEFLDQHPNQRNEIMRRGREHFGWPPAEIEMDIAGPILILRKNA